VTDVIDQVQAWNELHLDVSLRNQALKNLPETHPDFDGKHCVDCDDAVEPERLALQRVRCAECQHYQDRIFDARRRNGRPQ
jgi:RNA polymerase-binding transcription factor DksA